jgi:hypothetical protein
MSHNKIALHKKGLIKKPEAGPINETASVDNKIDMRHLEKASPEEAELLKKTMPPPCGRLRLQKPCTRRVQSKSRNTAP